MIEISDKSKCCGCSACVQSCPKQCIKLREDKEGFLYPFVETAECIDCRLCEKVCPYYNISEEKKPLLIEVAYNQDTQTRLESSSGGIFTLLAEHVIKAGGVIFGARFNQQWQVVHDYTDNINEISAFRGSKYVQSILGDSYKNVKWFLDEGRMVLFSGTPCQILALKRFLKKEYEKLFTIDIVCHGVPSPLVWSDYLKYINPNEETITSINMRDKSRSWSKYSYKVESKNKPLYDDYAANSEYLRMYINGFILRPSCYNCPVKRGKSQSDITLADAWGIKDVYPELNDEKGVSVVCVNSEGGMTLYNAISKVAKPFSEEDLIKGNPSYNTSSKLPPLRDEFWKLYEVEGMAAYYSIKKNKKQSLLYRIIKRIRHIVNQEK